MNNKPIKLKDLIWVKLFGEPALLIRYRVDKNTAPSSLYYYELRHGFDTGIPVSVEKSVVVNYFGAVLTTEPLNFGDKDYIEIGEKDWSYDTGDLDFSPLGVNDLEDGK